MKQGNIRVNVGSPTKRMRSDVARPAALITGGTSGIGAAYALAFAQRGYDLILTGRREDILEELCAGLEQAHGILAGYVIGDLASDSHVAELCGLIRRMPNLEILVNNAGYTRLELFPQDSIDAQVDIIKVHDVAAVRLTHAAIPYLVARAKLLPRIPRRDLHVPAHRDYLGFPAVINVSSIAAFQIGARNLMYDATKAFLLNFSESLHLELYGSGVRVQALCPGYTQTDFHMKLGMGPEHPIFRKHRFMSAGQVVMASLKCLKRDQVVCLPGFRNKWIAYLSRVAPRRMLYWLYQRRRGLDYKAKKPGGPESAR